jgi:hypothetical protein
MKESVQDIGRIRQPMITDRGWNVVTTLKLSPLPGPTIVSSAMSLNRIAG